MKYGPGWIEYLPIKKEHPVYHVRPQLGAAIADKIMDDALSKDKAAEINNKMQELLALQKRIDDAILTKHGSDRARLEQKRNEARGYFNTYVLPAYNQLYSMAVAGQKSAEDALSSVKNWFTGLFSGSPQMGAAFVLPAIPFAYISVLGIGAFAGTALYYIKTQREKEMAILNDPAFTSDQKRSLIEGGGIAGILGSAKGLAYIGLGITALLVLKSYIETRKVGP